MRTGAAQGTAGHFHEAGFYTSDDEFRALILPFAEEGIAAGEPVVLGYDRRKNDLLRSWLPESPGVTFAGDQSLYSSPALAIAAYRRLLEQHAAAGAGQIRVAGEVPHPGNGGRFEGWDRYECALNTVWDDFPVWGLCLYDATTAPATVLDAVERTHPWLLTPDGTHRASERYQDLLTFETPAPQPDPLALTVPLVNLTGCSAAAARHALLQAADGLVSGQTLDDLLIGTSEAVSNALRHGRPPVTVRIWAARDRVLVHIGDQGTGPGHPLAGLIPPAGTADAPGFGLWLLHQLSIDVAFLRDDGGFTLRLRAGAIPA